MADHDTQSPSARYAHRGNLIDGPLTGHLIRMAAPMTWGIFAIISFQLVDMFFIARLGMHELAAVSFTMPVTMGVFSLIMGLSIGMSSVLSRRIGQQAAGTAERDAVARLATHGLALGFMTGCVLAGLGLAFSDGLFRLMGATDDMMPVIRDFIHPWFAGAIFLTVPMIGNAALRAGGNALFPALVMTAASIVNAILSPLMIFGLLGFPEMGVRGAALAGVFANAGAMAACLYMMGPRMKLLRLRPFDAHLLADSWKKLLMIGLPAGLTNMVQPVVNGIIIAMLAAAGTQAVAAFGIVTRVEAFAFIVVMGLAGGMAPIIGQNWGAKRFDRVHETLRKAFTFNAAWSLAVALVLGLFGKAIAGLFSTDAQVVQIAALYFLIVPITYAAGNLVPGWASAFNAIGTPERAAAMIFIKHLLVLVPACFIGEYFWGATGLFAAIAATNLIAGLALNAYGWRQCRRFQSVAA
jgi:putative MATE family efflux protein